jgi:4-aminobutyrate aminotransferase/(S)-3-amino-2-methylpropionate transaminase
VRNYIDFNSSKGNYVQDLDGNTMLDLTGNAQLNPLGYNHELFRGALGKDWDNALINGFGADLVSSHTFYQLVESTFSGISPNGLTGVTLVNSRSAVADAVRSAMLERQQDGIGQSALYFSGSSHGSPLTLGGMICGWPTASYPRSASEEAEILEQVRSSVAEASTSAKHIAAIVIEPTQQSSGHRASDSFISSLSAICREFDAALIVDETNTGCYSAGNGTFWQYSGPADYVAFGGAAQATGYFSRQSGHSLAGNENDVRLLSTILEGVEQDSLAKRSE